MRLTFLGSDGKSKLQKDLRDSGGGMPIPEHWRGIVGELVGEGRSECQTDAIRGGAGEESMTVLHTFGAVGVIPGDHTGDAEGRGFFLDPTRVRENRPGTGE